MKLDTLGAEMSRISSVSFSGSHAVHVDQLSVEQAVTRGSLVELGSP